MDQPSSSSPSTSSHPQGKVALITGGAKRVGQAVAIKLAQQGYDILITYLTSQADASQTLKQIHTLGRRAEALRVDMASPDAPARIQQAAMDHFGRLDALINNASIFDPTPLATLGVDEFDRQMLINARTPIFLMQALAPMLAAHYRQDDPASMGRIVNFIDIHVMGQPLKGFMAYNASKAALMEATMTAAMELAPAITVNAIAPGVVAWAESYTPEAREHYMRRVPLGRAGTPQDAADAVAFLVKQAHYSTGQIIRLDGGRFIT